MISHAAANVLSWRADADGQRSWSGPEWLALTGQDEHGSRGMGWLDAVHPDDRRQVRDAWLAASVAGSVVSDHRLRAADGTYLQYRSAAVPSSRPDDAMPTWLGSSILVEDFLTLLADRDALLEALRHRVRNTLGTVRSMARLSLHGGESAEEFAAGLDGRIGALARVQAELIRNPLARTDLTQLVAGELAMVTVGEGERVTIGGPTVHLRPRAAENMGLALHELATNAVRHGALAHRDGTIKVDWRWQGEGEAARLRLDWREDCRMQGPQAVGVRGFGTHMLESILPYQLGAATSLRFAPAGLQLTIELPAATCVLPPD